MLRHDLTAATTGNDCPPASDTDFARRIQKAMIPSVLPAIENLRMGAFHIPASSRGCDLYDAIRVSEDLLAILMIDVVDTEARATMLSAMMKNCCVEQIMRGLSPAAIMERINSTAGEFIAPSSRISLLIGYLNLHDNSFLWCNRGRFCAMLLRGDGTVGEPLGIQSRPLAANGDEFMDEDRTHLMEGDSLVLFTGGYCGLVDRSKIGMHRFEVELIHECLRNGTVPDPAGAIEATITQLVRSTPSEEAITFIVATIPAGYGRTVLKKELGFDANEVVYLQFIRHIEEMGHAISVILAALDSSGFQDDAIRKMKIVLTELLVNGLIHGNRKNGTKKLTIGHSITPHRAVISVMDEGNGFDPSTVPDPTLAENLEKPSGRGLFIVRHFVDSMMFNQTGNRITVVKTNAV